MRNSPSPALFPDWHIRDLQLRLVWQLAGETMRGIAACALHRVLQQRFEKAVWLLLTTASSWDEFCLSHLYLYPSAVLVFQLPGKALPLVNKVSEKVTSHMLKVTCWQRKEPNLKWVCFSQEKNAGSGEDCRSSGLGVSSAAPSPGKFVRHVLILLFLPQTTAAGSVVALAGLPFSEEGGRSRGFKGKTACWHFLDFFLT